MFARAVSVYGVIIPWNTLKRRSYTNELDASPLMVKSALISGNCYGTPHTNITHDALIRWCDFSTVLYPSNHRWKYFIYHFHKSDYDQSNDPKNED